DSEGLILLTDDGDLAFRLTHPRFEVEKEYRVLLDRAPTVENLRAWREGVELEGEMTMPAWVEVLERASSGTWIRVVMREGRKRQIREIARMLGYDVLRLIRVREGPLNLGELAPGQWRDLTPTEVQMLRAHTQHIPSRAAEEEAERRMADRNRPEGRRLRVIRGVRRPSFDRQDSPASQGAPDTPAEPTDALEARPAPDDDRAELSDADSAQPPRSTDRARPRSQQGPSTYDERRPRSTPQRDQQRGFDRGGASPQRQPRGGSDRYREGGYRERSGGGYNSASGPRRDADSRNRGYGSDRPTDARRGYGSDRPNDARRGYGSDRGPSSNQRGWGGDNRRDYGEQRGNERRDNEQRGNERRDYGEQRDNEQRGNERRDYGEQRDGPRARPSQGTAGRRGFGGPPRDRGPRSQEDRPRRSFDPNQRGPSRGQGADRSERPGRPARPGGPARSGSGGPGGERREGGFGSSGRGRAPARPGGRSGPGQYRSGGGSSRGGPARPGGNRSQRPTSRGPRKGGNNR
ncbi:MAG TPA: pseudouridine synthase, partial [Herpetosiphonaceae bacterium]